MNIFDYTDHVQILKKWISLQPKGGRGIPRQIAEHLRVSSVLVSQILKGTRALQMEHAYGLAQFMSLSVSETDYFLMLVQYENGGSQEYRQYLKSRIDQHQAASLEVKQNVSQDIELSDETKARFYSHWMYSAIRLSTDIKDFQTPQALAQKFQLPIEKVHYVLSFLVQNRLCLQEGGRFQMLAKSTHLESDSPWILNRQIQWRQKGIQQMEKGVTSDLFYTGPMVLSKKDIEWVRAKLVSAIKEVTSRVRSSESEESMCLNIDWFQI